MDNHFQELNCKQIFNGINPEGKELLKYMVKEDKTPSPVYSGFYVNTANGLAFVKPTRCNDGYIVIIDICFKAYPQTNESVRLYFKSKEQLEEVFHWVFY